MNDTSDPGPNQQEVNDLQEIFNEEVKSDVDALVDDSVAKRQLRVNERREEQFDRQTQTNEASSRRADVSETLSARGLGGVVQRDAESAASMLRADVSEELAAAGLGGVVQRDAEHDAQAITNEVNKAAVDALQAVGDAASQVTILLSENVKRGRRWTIALASVVSVMCLLGAGGYLRFQHDADVVSKTTKERCDERNIQLADTKNEFINLVSRVEKATTNPVDRANVAKFLASYRIDIDSRFKPIECGAP